VAERDEATALGKAITIRRVELGLSRNDLRDRSGLSYPYVAELEKGLKSPSSKALEAIARALEVRPHELLARAEELADVPGTLPMMQSASPSSPSPPQRWFGPAASSIMPEARVGGAAPAAEALTEERVREIVREELRRLIGEVAQ
jgi:transcriptional regulator with XRE-family HTH domain